MKTFLVTLQFMTRLPIPHRWTDDFDFEQTGQGVCYFPWVGLLLGTIASVMSTVGFYYLDWGALLSAAVYLLVLALATGGFHLDGLADTCDGLFSARQRDDMLLIMKDSRLGTHGALALIFVVMLKVLIIARLWTLSPAITPGVLLLCPLVGRSLMPVLMYHQHYAREKGLGHVYIGRISRQALLTCLLISAVAVTLVLQHVGLIAWGVTYCAALMYRTSVNRVLGGQTGDTLGAGNELFELCFLLAMTSVMALYP